MTVNRKKIKELTAKDPQLTNEIPYDDGTGTFKTTLLKIKTLFGTAAAAWGSITGTLSSQTDLQNALNAKQNSLGYTAEDSANKTGDIAGNSNSTTKYPTIKGVYDWVVNLLSGKQDTLVSGTSIKTINGTSVLGAGDIAIASGITIDTTPITGGAAGQILFESATNKTTSLDDFRWDTTYGYVHLKQTGLNGYGYVVQNKVAINAYTHITHQSNGYGKIYSSEQLGIQSYSTMALIAGGAVAADINIHSDRLVVKWNRNIGIDLTSPTAALHIKAGTASLAPLKINAGTLLTTPEGGAIESDGTHIYWTDAGGTRKQLD